MDKAQQPSIDRAPRAPAFAWIAAIERRLPASLVTRARSLGLRRGIPTLVLAWLILLLGIDAVYPIDVSGFFLSLLLILLYLLPTLLAFDRRHGRRLAIAVLNVLLGWTMLGWVGVLAWSLTQNHRGVAPDLAVRHP